MSVLDAHCVRTGGGSGSETPVEFKSRVESIRLTATTNGYVLVTAAIRVVDAPGMPVSGATVSGIWSMPKKGTLQTERDDGF